MSIIENADKRALLPEQTQLDLEKLRAFRINALEEAPGVVDEQTWNIAKTAYNFRIRLDDPLLVTIRVGRREFTREKARELLDQMCIVVARNASPEAATALGSDIITHEGNLMFTQPFLASSLELQA